MGSPSEASEERKTGLGADLLVVSNRLVRPSDFRVHVLGGVNIAYFDNRNLQALKHLTSELPNIFVERLGCATVLRDDAVRRDRAGVGRREVDQADVELILDQPKRISQ